MSTLNFDICERNEKITEINNRYDSFVTTLQNKIDSLVVDIGIELCAKSPKGTTTVVEWQEAAKEIERYGHCFIDSLERDRKKEIADIIANS